MYEALEHWKQYKQEMSKFINQLVTKNGTTKY